MLLCWAKYGFFGQGISLGKVRESQGKSGNFIFENQWQPCNGEYSITDRALQVVHNERDLGVIVQDNLKVSQNCSEVVKTCNRILGMVSRTFTSRLVVLGLGLGLKVKF